MSGGGGDGKDDFERRSKRRRTDDGRRDWRERAAGVLVRRPAGGVSSAAKGRRIRRTRQRQRASGRERVFTIACGAASPASFAAVRRPSVVGLYSPLLPLSSRLVLVRPLFLERSRGAAAAAPTAQTATSEREKEAV